VKVSRFPLTVYPFLPAMPCRLLSDSSKIHKPPQKRGNIDPNDINRTRSVPSKKTSGTKAELLKKINFEKSKGGPWKTSEKWGYNFYK